MPHYDYVCDACDHQLEVYQSIKANPKKKCPECGKLKLRRLIGGGGAIMFRGSGFYITDYRSDSYRSGAAADKKTSSSTATSSKKSKSSKSKSSTNAAKPK